MSSLGSSALRRDEYSPRHLEFSGMSQCVAVGDTVYLSGQASIGPDGVMLETSDAATQAEQIFENMGLALEGVGCSLKHVVKLTCFLVNAADYAAYSEVKSKVFEGGSPAGSVVVVAGLLDPRMRLEVEAVAVSDRR